MRRLPSFTYSSMVNCTTWRISLLAARGVALRPKQGRGGVRGGAGRDRQRRADGGAVVKRLIESAGAKAQRGGGNVCKKSPHLPPYTCAVGTVRRGLPSSGVWTWPVSVPLGTRPTLAQAAVRRRAGRIVREKPSCCCRCLLSALQMRAGHAEGPVSSAQCQEPRAKSQEPRAIGNSRCLCPAPVPLPVPVACLAATMLAWPALQACAAASVCRLCLPHLPYGAKA